MIRLIIPPFPITEDFFKAVRLRQLAVSTNVGHYVPVYYNPEIVTLSSMYFSTLPKEEIRKKIAEIANEHCIVVSANTTVIDEVQSNKGVEISL
jgi:3-dehydroquinate synthetase